MRACPLTYPPRPRPLPALPSLLRTIFSGDGDLLSLVPASAYRVELGYLGVSRRSTHIVNRPDLVRALLADDGESYPKSDLMVGALEALVGESMFVTSGATWRKQRRMIDPAFSHMRLSHAFAAMNAAVDAAESRLDGAARKGEPISLDLVMSHLTADIICRTVFSSSIEDEAIQDVFDAFSVFERSVAQTELRRLIFDPAFKRVPQPLHVLKACERIRARLEHFVAAHEQPNARFDDIAADVIAARDPETNEGFTRKALLDQLGVFFLAGHETTASALTWAIFLLAQNPTHLDRLRAECDVSIESAPSFDGVRRLSFARAVFKETLRLYPPITFLPRVALGAGRIGTQSVRPGALIMIAPWVVHRHTRYWSDPDRFDPDRFMPERETGIETGTYLPFGLGPRVCVGAGFATIEAMLILSRLCRRYEFDVLEPEAVRPVARLTTRPKHEIRVRIRRRDVD